MHGGGGREAVQLPFGVSMSSVNRCAVTDVPLSHAGRSGCAPGLVGDTFISVASTTFCTWAPAAEVVWVPIRLAQAAAGSPQVEVVGPRPEQCGLGMVVDLRSLGGTQPRVWPLNVPPAVMEEGGLVVDAAVDVDTAIVSGAAIEHRADGSSCRGRRSCRRLMSAGRQSAVAPRPSSGPAPGPFAHRAERSASSPIHVGHRLVDRARLGVVHQLRRVLVTAWVKLVRDDIVGIP